jgi:hypothetical protein
VNGEAGAVDLYLFDEVADALHGMIPPALGVAHQRARRYGIKVWFGDDETNREHYEAQVISRDAVADAKVLALEVGFHAEHPQVAANDAVIAQVAREEARWRKKLGAETVVGAFLGRANVWRRVSETWADPDLDDPALPVVLAARLTDYVVALEPVLRKRR